MHNIFNLVRNDAATRHFCWKRIWVHSPEIIGRCILSSHLNSFTSHKSSLRFSLQHSYYPFLLSIVFILLCIFSWNEAQHLFYLILFVVHLSSLPLFFSPPVFLFLAMSISLCGCRINNIFPRWHIIYMRKRVGLNDDFTPRNGNI